jgi:DNA-binding response OmpR family regulator
MLCMLLRKRGVQCDTAAHASQMLEMVRRNGRMYQAVFLDTELPGPVVSMARHSSDALPTVPTAGDAPAAASENVLPQKGWAVKMMRQECGYKNMIFGLSGAMLEDDASDLLAAGADCVITKQLRGKQLDAVLQFIKVCPCRALPSPYPVPPPDHGLLAPRPWCF